MIRLARRSRRDLVCQQVAGLVTDYLEDTLPRPVRRRFEAHLAGCPDCPEYLAQMRAIAALAASGTPDDLAPQIRAELISLYRQWRADGTA